jgi:Membrane domain of glycerophosphoryl diester phosphodiesterase
MPATMLRPLSLGELLDRTFSLYKENFLLFFGVMVWPSLLAIAVGLLNTTLRAMVLKPGVKNVAVAGFGIGGAMILFALAYWVAYTLALGATTFAVSDVYLGRTATIGESYRKMRGSVWRLSRLFAYIAVQIFVLMVLMVIAMSLVSVLGAAVRIIATVVLFLALIVVPVWMVLRYSVAVPALMLETLKARAAARRSVQLMKGNFGRAFLLILLMAIIAAVTAMVFQGPFMAAAILMASKGQPSVLLMGLGTVFGGLGGALAAPLIMIGLVLLYYDIRVRKEAFDLQLLMGPPIENVSGDSPAAAAAPSI